jgi:hypothetical protein
MQCWSDAQVVRPGAFQVASAALSGAGGGALGASVAGRGRAGSGKAALAAAVIGGTVSAALAAVPLLNTSVTCEVWGNRQSRRKDLEAVALNMASRMFVQLGPFARWTTSVVARLEHDVMGKYVKAEIATIGGLSAVQLLLADNRLAIPELTAFFPQEDGVAEITTTAPARNPQFGGLDVQGRVSRGTYLAQLVAAALQAPCSTPPSPTDPATVLNRTP